MSRPATKNSLYVGSLAKDVTEEILRYAFMPFGPIKEIDLPADESTNCLFLATRLTQQSEGMHS